MIRGAVANVQLSASVTKGPVGICAANIGDNLFEFSKGRAKIGRHKTFAGRLTNGHGAFVLIKGLIKAHAVTGSFIVEAPLVQDTGGVLRTRTCNSGKVTFTAAASGGQVHGGKYSGVIPAGGPISFRVSANGKAVDGLVLQYEPTECPGGGVGPGLPPKTHFKTIAIKSGSFSGTISDHRGSGASGSIHISATFFGRVAAGEVTATERDPGVPTCTNSGDFTASAK